MNEVDRREPATVLEMPVKAPFPMRVTYAFEKAGPGTRASVRVEGDPGAF